MSAPVPVPQIRDSAPADPGDALRFVARQPILDLRGEVHGYELLFRMGQEDEFRAEGDFATRTILDDTVIFGFNELSRGLPAFVNCTAESLTGELVHVLPPQMTVLEILETLEPTPDLVAACRKLKAEGFRLALDDFAWELRFAPLVELADYIKVDFVATTAETRGNLLRLVRGSKAKLIAEKLETPEEYRQACDEGFTLFQGYFFCRPEVMKKRKIPADCAGHFEILRQLQRDPLNLYELCPLVKSNSALVYRLLRMVNSPMCAIAQQIDSIKTALVALGEETIRRVVTLAVTSELNAGQPAEILRMALVRARFCEQIAPIAGLIPTEQYLLGMFSLLPAMVKVPMEKLVLELPLRDEIRDALTGGNIRERCLLAWVEANEWGQFNECDAIAKTNGLDEQQLFRGYAEAVLWAEHPFSKGC